MTDRGTSEATSTRTGDWLFALLAVALVPLYLETFVMWQWLQAVLTPRVLAWLPLGLAVILGVGVFAWAVHAVGRSLIADGLWRRMTWLILGAVCAGAAIHLTDPNFPAKNVHLFQYAFLALVVRRAYGDRLVGYRLAVVSIVTAGLLGVHDEMLQGLHPERRFGVTDILVNALSAAAGACMATAAARPVGMVAIQAPAAANRALILSVTASLAGVAILIVVLNSDPMGAATHATVPALLAPFAGLACWVALTRTGALRHLTAFVAVVIALSALTVVPPLAALLFDIPFA